MNQYIIKSLVITSVIEQINEPTIHTFNLIFQNKNEILKEIHLYGTLNTIDINLSKFNISTYFESRYFINIGDNNQEKKYKYFNNTIIKENYHYNKRGVFVNDELISNTVNKDLEFIKSISNNGVFIYSDIEKYIQCDIEYTRVNKVSNFVIEGNDYCRIEQR